MNAAANTGDAEILDRSMFLKHQSEIGLVDPTNLPSLIALIPHRSIESDTRWLDIPAFGNRLLGQMNISTKGDLVDDRGQLRVAGSKM